MAKTLTVQDFFKMFADDDACLAHLFSVRFGSLKACPKCLKVTKFHKLAKAPAYACQWCGHHIHPMKGTPFAFRSSMVCSTLRARRMMAASR